MMLRRIMPILLIGIIAFGVVDPPHSNAQEASGDLLVISHFGDLWVTDEINFAAPTLFTPCGITNSGEPMQSRLVMSPDGDRIAYVTWPTAFVELLESAGGFTGATPTNIRMCDSNSLQEILLSGQPENADFPASVFYSHSIPVWSPDGTKLAWTRMSGTGEEMLLQVYDVAAGTISTVPSTFPPQFGIPQPFHVEWGEPGLLVEIFTQGADPAVATPELLLFDEAGTLLQQFPAEIEEGFLLDFFWADGIDGTPVVVGDFSDPFTRQLNISTGEWALIDGVLEYYAPEAPEGSFTLSYSPNDSFEALWEATRTDGFKYLLDYRGHRGTGSIAISPSGQTIAFATDQVYLWQSEDQVSVVGLITDGQIDMQTSLVWSPMRWRIVAGGYGG